MKEVFSHRLRQDAAIDRPDLASDQYADANSAALQDLAHDLRQPLGVIETIAYYLELTAPDESTCIHVRRIRAMVAQTHGILERAATRTEHFALEPSSC